MINRDFIKKPLILMMLLSSSILALAIYLIVTQWESDWALTHQATETAPISLPSAQKKHSLTPPAEAHLFGQSFSKNNVPITNLELMVTGIVKSDTALSKAYLSVAGQPSKIYRVGDSLPDGVKIYAITNDTIILENNGRLEKIPLQREKLAFKSRDITEDA